MKMLIALILAAVPLPLAADETPARDVGVEGNISFPAQGGIRNFRADNDKGVWLEDRQRKWYYASFIGPCPEIRFAQGIGIDTRGSARFDKFSRILVGKNSCAIATLVTADKPLPEREQRRLRKAAEAEVKAETAAN
jgi:Family of unknown function (DUF6491)